MTQDAINLLQAEHQEMRALLDKMNTQIKAPTPDARAVLDLVSRFEASLSLHERREEDVLFPSIKGMGPVQLVLQEHERLAPLRARLAAALATYRADASADNLKVLGYDAQQVAYCLSGHFMKEEQLCFRIAQAMLSPDQLTEMGATMAAMGEAPAAAR
ncbi:MAG: hemerythrin domain-containing protein [Nitrospirae bacterium]|nr:hemerythrin domain-containing protein [Nitrospirota bacterium]